MKRILYALLALVAVASAACRQYDVDVYKNFNDTVYGPVGVTQSFTCTSDSLLWAEFFVGAANSGGQYHFEVQTYPDGQPVFEGDTNAGDTVQYRFVRANLTPRTGAPKLIKGETYVLKVTHSNPGHNEELNWYADTTNPYQYGRMFVGGDAPLRWDLCARIEGIDRPTARGFFGLNGMECRWDSATVDHHYALMDTLGIGMVREDIYWHELESVPGNFRWDIFDPIAIAAAAHHIRLQVILQSCPRWASTHVDTIENGNDTVWDRDCPPQGLAEPVKSADSVNRDNYYAYYVYRVVSRYKPGSSFWTLHNLPESTAVAQYYEVFNEPNYWRNPDAGWGYRIGASYEDSIAIVESLYARTADVACQAAHLADPNARLLVGSLGEVEWEHPKGELGPRLVRGKDWLRAYYQWRDSTTTAGVSVHPYQHGDNDVAFNPVVMVQELDTVRSIMKANGEQNKELWANELSWNNGDTTQTWLAPRSMPETYAFVLAGTPTSFCNSIEWAGLMGPPARLLNPPEKMPCCYAYLQMTQELLGKRLNGRVLSGDSATDARTGVYEFEDTASEKKTWVGWRNRELGAEAVALKVPVRTEFLDTNYLAGVGCDNQHRYDVHAGTDGWFHINVDTIPVYVFENPLEAPSRPDLVVDSIWTSFVPGPVWPQKRRLQARIRNVGNAWSPPISTDGQTTAPVRFYANGSYIGSVSSLQPIQPQTYVNVYCDGVWQVADAGDYLVKAVVNENRAFVELNWDNNMRYRLFQILPVYKADGGTNGVRTMARATNASPIQAVAEFTEAGKPLVFYCPSPDSATSDWYSLAAGRSSAIGLVGGNPWITYIRADSASSHETLYAAVQNADSGWKYVALYGALSGQHLGPPSLAVFRNGTGRIGNVAVPCYENVGGQRSMILLCQFDTVGGSGSVVLDTVDFCDGSYADSAAVVAVGSTDTIRVLYSKADTVYLRRLNYAPTSTSRPNAWSAASMASNAGVSACHPSCERIGSRLWVAYTQHWIHNDTTYWEIEKASCCDTTSTIAWEGVTGGSTINIYPTDFPCISTSKVVAWAESSSTTHHWVVKADVADSLYLTLSNPDSNCRFVSILCDTAVQTTPSTSTTGVYCMWLQQVAGETSAVQYRSKQFLTSNADANVTMYNQGKKLTLDHNDSLSCVMRTQQGSIYYAKKKDGVEGWNSSLLRNTGDMPAVTTDYLNRVYVADRDFANPIGGAATYDNIYCQTRPAGCSTWTSFQVYSSQLPVNGTAQHKIGPPSIVACIGDTAGLNRSAAYIVFTVYEPQPTSGKSTTIMVKVSTTGVVYVDTLCTVQGKGDSFPSIALHPTAGQGYGLHVAWQSGTEVYVKKTTNQDQPQFTMKRTWSSFYNLSNTAGKSKHCVIAADTDVVLVAWAEGDSGRILTKSQAPGSAYNSWNDTVNVSGCPDTCCDYASIALSHGDSTIVEYQKKLSSTNYDIIARVNFHSNLNISNSSTSSTYPHCIIHLHQDSIPVIGSVWTEALSINYAEVGYKRWQLGLEGGGGIQDYSIFNPNIKPALYAPAPNPFNHAASIRFSTNIRGLTRVQIMDITGRRVRNLLSTVEKPGVYNLTWNARDDRERKLAGGVYFVRLLTPNYHETRKVIMTQ